MRKRATNPLRLAVLLIFSVFTLTRCAKTGSNLTTSPVTYLAIINGTSFSSNATVFLNDTLATLPGGVAAGQFSTKYGTIRPGSYDVKFKAATNDSLLSEIPSSSFDTLNFYTLLLYTASGAATVQSAKIADNFASLSATQANYRFFNLSASYSSVDLYLNSSLAQPGRTVADNVSNVLYNGFQPVAEGAYTITVKSAGTDSVIVSQPNVSMAAGSAYTLFLTGVKGSTTNPLVINLMQASR